MSSRRWINLLVVAGLLVAFVPGGQAHAERGVPQVIDRDAQYVPGEVLVTFGSGLSAAEGAAQASALAGKTGGQVTARFGDMALLSFAPDADVAALAAQMVSAGLVRGAQPNYIYWIPEDGSERALQSGTPQDEGYRVNIPDGQTHKLSREQLAGMRSLVRRNGRSVAMSTFPSEMSGAGEDSWGWDRVNADIIWQDAKASPAVCVVDSGVDGKHKDLAKRVINGYDFVNDDKVPEDDNGHGTHVAGTVTAINNNGATTALGVSNSKVVAVKVLNAQGWGTSYSIAAGVRFCANRADVRIINLSLGGGAEDPLEYAALSYAVLEKGKTVVAASGNSYSSELMFPAAWGDPDVAAPGGGSNQIHKGLISVAAARINPPTYPVWVDTNNNGTWEAGESYEYDDCAVSFTNFGKHINLVAPGHWIYSTTPTSYPFFNQYYYGDRAGYEFYSGTSMAAPYVAGAAARVLSAFPNLGNGSENPAVETVKERLVDSGRALVYAVQPVTDPSFDPEFPYDDAQYNNGVAQEILNPSGSLVYAIKAPFCWPDASGPYGAEQDMSNARYLNLSAAMQRFGLAGEIFDATTALPLKDALARVVDVNGALLSASKVSKDNALAVWLNLPISENEDEFYFMQVSKKGYTIGNQYYGYASAFFEPGEALYGEVSMTPTSSVAVPSAKNVSAVVNWLPYPDANLDLYLWLPEDSAKPGYLGTGWLQSYQPAYDPSGEHDLGQGTLLPPEVYGGDISPYAQLIHDGGAEAFSSDILPFDTITIKAKPGTNQPWYTDPAVSDAYHLIITDYSRAYAGGDGIFPLQNFLTFDTTPSSRFIYPVLRVWKNGRLAWNDIIQVFYFDENNALHIGQNCDQASIDWWHAADIKGSTVTAMRTCGDADPGSGMYILPYE